MKNVNLVRCIDENYDVLNKLMCETEQYEKEKLTIDLIWANKISLLLLIPILLVFGLPYYLLWKSEINLKSIFENLQLLDSLYIFGIVFFGIVVHELIHGISWSIFAKNGFRSIKFGILWKMFTPYCHCNEPLKVREYIIGAIAPAILLGIVPAIIAIFTGSFGLLIFGMFFTMAASGDFLIINIIRVEKSNDLVQDHPSEAGCYIFRKIGE
ncbi:DUF3267 domain-containing protein [Sphingobacterium sp. BIGb0165]|uniref:DUF3267 domain-containing protein n=1 Tax=Sphingobacterium sp. BIGb0165 TaxID=2940615 RepID=UPI002166C825|nr:DUF3267 domain-containing protein [Sphingobacterium sp. BIGb0165]